MNILFDARYTKTGDYHDGISRYSAELGNSLYSTLKPGDSLSFLVADDEQKKWFPAGATFIPIHSGASIKEPFTALILNKYKPDIVYSPMQTIGTFGRKYKSILTIHDLIYYRHPHAPKFLPLPVRIGWWLYHQSYWPQRLLLKGADLLTTVSNTSAAEIGRAKMTPLTPVVIANAPQTFTAKPRHDETIKNVIYMGSFMPYKNVETLIKGMAHLPGKTLHLLSRVNDARRAELIALIPEEAEVIFHNGVSDAEYEALLSENALLATASLDEGYGIPVAEAMAMGVPVVISDIPVFREVGGEGALYFNPQDPVDFAAKVHSLDSQEIRDRHIAAGISHIATFSWKRSAETLYKSMKRLIGDI